MTLPAEYVCLECGAEYGGYAEYCNACGSGRFERIGGPPQPQPKLRKDGTVLIGQGALWLVCLIYLLGERWVDHPVEVFWAWALSAAASLTLGFVTKHLRAALFFITLGAVFSALTAWIRA